MEMEEPPRHQELGQQVQMRVEDEFNKAFGIPQVHEVR